MPSDSGARDAPSALAERREPRSDASLFVEVAKRGSGASAEPFAERHLLSLGVRIKRYDRVVHPWPQKRMRVYLKLLEFRFGAESAEVAYGHFRIARTLLERGDHDGVDGIRGGGAAALP